jgi:hypothetical protein
MLLASIYIAIITDSVARQYNMFSQSVRLSLIINVKREIAATLEQQIAIEHDLHWLSLSLLTRVRIIFQDLSRLRNIHCGTTVGFSTSKMTSRPWRVMQFDAIET